MYASAAAIAQHDSIINGRNSLQLQWMNVGFMKTIFNLGKPEDYIYTEHFVVVIVVFFALLFSILDTYL